MIPLQHVIIKHEYNCIEVDHVSASTLVWLVETFGPAGKRWFHYNNKIYFRNEKDYMWFELAT